MKKIIAVTVVIVMCMFTFNHVLAQQNDVVFREKGQLPRTRITSGMSLMSLDCELTDAVKTAWENFDTIIDVREFKIPYSRAYDVYWSIMDHEPSYYYVDSSTYISSSNGYAGYIYVNYRETDRQKINAYLAQLDAATQEILLPITDGMSDFDKIMTVHDYMALNYQYDTTYSNYDISIMLTKTGVCQAYAYAFQHVMNELGIECTYVSSNSMNHGWNLVKADDEWYHIDVTWDDPTHDKFGQVRHTYALLSTQRIMSLDKPHYGFDTGDLTADSTKYDNASWRGGVGSIVYANGFSHWFDGDDLVNSDGDIIYKDIVNNNRWFISQYSYLNGIFAGLAEHNGKLYFNSHNTIYSYDTNTKKTDVVYSGTGICGLYINKNTLYYTKHYEYTTNGTNRLIGFEKGGTIELDDIRIGGSYRRGGKVVTGICNTSGSPVYAFAFNGSKAETHRIENQGVSTVEFDMHNTADIFVWDASLKPLMPKRTVE